MPKKEYRHTPYAKAAKKRGRAKVTRIRFSLNATQSESAKELDLECHNVETIHQLAKKLFVDYLKNSINDHSDPTIFSLERSESGE